MVHDNSHAGIACQSSCTAIAGKKINGEVCGQLGRLDSLGMRSVSTIALRAGQGIRGRSGAVATLRRWGAVARHCECREAWASARHQAGGAQGAGKGKVMKPPQCRL